MAKKPPYDHTEAELLARLRKMYEAGNYVSSPNDIARELERKSNARYARISVVTSIVGVVVATVAVILSAIAIGGQ